MQTCRFAAAKILIFCDLRADKNENLTGLFAFHRLAVPAVDALFEVVNREAHAGEFAGGDTAAHAAAAIHGHRFLLVELCRLGVKIRRLDVDVQGARDVAGLILLGRTHIHQLRVLFADDF